MSSKERREKNAREFDEVYAARQAEQHRKDSLDMWSRINEAEASEDVKDILHRIAVHVGLET